VHHPLAGSDALAAFLAAANEPTGENAIAIAATPATSVNFESRFIVDLRIRTKKPG
jgi:hypothetical protein